MIGIYSITCTATKECYIGQSIRIKTRWKEHQSALKCNKHYNYKLQEAYNQYGEINFVYKVLELCSKNELNNKEQYYIKLYNSFNNGYNLTEGGEDYKGVNNPMYGKSGKLSPRFKDIIYQLDQKGNIIATYESANLAAQSVNGQAGHINDCLQTWKEHKASPVGASHPERLTHKGYQWIFKQDYELLNKYGYDFSKKRTKKSLTIKDLIDEGALDSNI